MEYRNDIQPSDRWGACEGPDEAFLKELYPNLDYDDARNRYNDEHISGLRQYLKRNRFHTPADYYRVTGIADPWGIADLIDGDGFVIF